MIKARLYGNIIKVNYLLFTIIVLLAGCATNPFAQYYHESHSTKNRVFVGFSGEPSVYVASDIKTEELRVLEDGYVRVGVSAFTGAHASLDDLKQHAKTINAEIVLIQIKHIDTVQGAIPYTVPNPNQMGMIGNTVVSLPGGYSTHYMPYTVDRFDQVAFFFRKVPPMKIGIIFENLSPALKAEIGRNRGILVVVVVKNTPAFYADIVRGDIITKINGIEVVDTNSAIEALKTTDSARVIPIEVIRKGEIINFSLAKTSN